MAARTPRRSFAAPFVVTLAAAPACYVQSGPPPQSAPAQPPPTQTAQPEPQPQQPGPMIANPPPPATNQPAQPPPPSHPVVVANPPRPTQPAPPQQQPNQNPAQTSPSRWTVYQAKDGACMAAIKVECQPKATCNPPPPFKYACPTDISLEKPITVATYDGNSCFVEYAMPACPPKTACNPPRPRPVACPKR